MANTVPDVPAFIDHTLLCATIMRGGTSIIALDPIYMLVVACMMETVSTFSSHPAAILLSPTSIL